MLETKLGFGEAPTTTTDLGRSRGSRRSGITRIKPPLLWERPRAARVRGAYEISTFAKNTHPSPLDKASPRGRGSSSSWRRLAPSAAEAEGPAAARVVAG